MIKKATLSCISLLVSVMLFAQAVKYNAAAQKKYLPETLDGIFLGMTCDQLKQIVPADKLTFEASLLDSIVKLTEYTDRSIEGLIAATYYFVGSDTTEDAATVPAKNRLFKIVLEFDQQDARSFVQRFKNNKAIKGGLSNDGWKWTFKSADAVDWIVTYDDGFFVSITGNIKGTPWKDVPKE